MTTGWRGQGEYPPERPLPRASRQALVAIKGLHTLAWFSIEACMIYLLYAGFARRSDRRAAIAGAIVGGESLVFAASGFRCPLTSLAERLGARRGSVTDIYLPKWFAHNLAAIHACYSSWPRCSTGEIFGLKGEGERTVATGTPAKEE
ncbi:MAG TPA: hypothetical protein VHK65_06460 [Candidatus Dormibacteraeota bacterium]|nr:hypothetical protein [Candidatus Dormibacteraeota bacterium]